MVSCIEFHEFEQRKPNIWNSVHVLLKNSMHKTCSSSKGNEETELKIPSRPFSPINAPILNQIKIS